MMKELFARLRARLTRKTQPAPVVEKPPPAPTAENEIAEIIVGNPKITPARPEVLRPQGLRQAPAAPDLVKGPKPKTKASPSSTATAASAASIGKVM